VGASGRLRNGLPTLADPASHEGAVAPSAVLRLAADKAGCSGAAACARPPALAAAPPSSPAPPPLPVVVRRVHDADIVPHLPPRIFGYAHAPREVWARPCAAWGARAANATGEAGCSPGGEGYLLCSPADGEDAACSHGLSLPSVADHLTYMTLPISRLC
jgi:hypothetical protein